jgi:outer membrane protein assembly factor BamA
MKQKYIMTAIALLASAILASAPASAYRGDGQPILGIAVYGNYNIDRDLVVRQFGLAAGDTCMYEAVREGLDRVMSLSGVRYATYKLNVDSEGRGVFVLLMITEEERTWTVYPLISRNFADRIAFGAAFSETNLRGRNERLFLSAMVNGALILEAKWVIPRTFGTERLTMGIEAAYRGYRWPYPSFEQKLVDDRIKWFEGYLFLGFRLAGGLSIFLEPGLEVIRAGDPMLEHQGEGDVPDAPSGTLLTVNTGLVISRIDQKFYPESGVQAGVSVKSWGIVQNDPAFSSTRLSADAAVFLDIGRPLLSVSARGVLNEAGIPAYLYEHLGGTSTIRGHEFGVFYGENSVLIRTDLRVPLNFRDISELGNPMILVDMSVFVDTGAVWDGGETLTGELFYSGTGLAMSFIVKEGWLLKFGYSWPMDPDGRFFFDIGTMF